MRIFHRRPLQMNTGTWVNRARSQRKCIDSRNHTVNRDTFSLQGFVCRLLIFTFITFALICVFECRHRKWGRKELPE